MIDLVLPYLIGVALGITPPGDTGTPDPVQPTPTAAVDVTGSGDDLTADRPPEDQTPTGTFTTATEVRPILDMTKSNWVALREYDGQDLIYFTHLFGWRCGLWDLRYGINGAPATTVVPMEPCYEDTGTPNAMTDVANFLPYVAHPLGSVERISVEIVYDDGETDAALFDRSAVQIP